MLKHLFIQNYALIDHLDLTPDRALNIITGETGAGKSIMLGAIGLLMGNRADPKALFDQKKKCIVEGTFDVTAYELAPFFEQHDLDYEPTCMVRREITPSGKSRAFINDSPATLTVVRALGAYLMDIHSQHDNLMLASNRFQTQVVDTFAVNDALRHTYHDLYRRHHRAHEALERLKKAAAQARQELDFKTFQLEELNAAHLERGEQVRIEEELEVLEHAEEIKSRLNLTLDYLTRTDPAAEQLIQGAVQSLDKVVGYAQAYAQYRERLQSCLIELRDVAAEIEGIESLVEVDPNKTQLLQERLDTLFALQKKHGVDSEDALITIAEGLESDLHDIHQYDEQIAAARRETEQLSKQLRTAADALSASRRAVTAQIEDDVRQMLRGLGMPNGTLKVTLEPTNYLPSGADLISFLFSANKGVPPQPLKSVASGGEFSRLMLSMKALLAGKTALP
ncbi:MAG: AAA family ATPase, partial [Catalinimonas sp.]